MQAINTNIFYNYPDEIYELYKKAYDGVTMQQFVATIAELTNNRSEEEANKLKGDAFEVFSYIFFNSFQTDNRFGLSNYTPTNANMDYGVDATGINVNEVESVVQVKYRHNPLDLITYEDTAKLYTDARHRHGKALNKHGTMYIMTTANGVTPKCSEFFGDKLIVVGRPCLSQLLDNNKNFWKNAYNTVYKIYDQ